MDTSSLRDSHNIGTRILRGQIELLETFVC